VRPIAFLKEHQVDGLAGGTPGFGKHLLFGISDNGGLGGRVQNQQAAIGVSGHEHVKERATISEANSAIMESMRHEYRAGL
jgi:hypothetical protein